MLKHHGMTVENICQKLYFKGKKTILNRFINKDLGSLALLVSWETGIILSAFWGSTFPIKPWFYALPVKYLLHFAFFISIEWEI